MKRLKTNIIRVLIIESILVTWVLFAWAVLMYGNYLLPWITGFWIGYGVADLYDYTVRKFQERL